MLGYVFWAVLCSTMVVCVLLFFSSWMKMSISYISWHSPLYIEYTLKSLLNWFRWPCIPPNFNTLWHEVLSLRYLCLTRGRIWTYRYSLQTQQWRPSVPRLLLEALLRDRRWNCPPDLVEVSLLSFTWPCWGTGRISGSHLGSSYDPPCAPAGHPRPCSAPSAASAGHQWHQGGTHWASLLSPPVWSPGEVQELW